MVFWKGPKIERNLNSYGLNWDFCDFPRIYELYYFYIENLYICERNNFKNYLGNTYLIKPHKVQLNKYETRQVHIFFNFSKNSLSDYSCVCKSCKTENICRSKNWNTVNFTIPKRVNNQKLSYCFGKVEENMDRSWIHLAVRVLFKREIRPIGSYINTKNILCKIGF